VLRDLLVSSAFVLAFASFHAPADAALVPTGFHDDAIASGFHSPSNFDFLPDGRILVIEQTTALVLVVDPTGAVPPDTVGRVPDVGPVGGENGLLGIAVDPRWPTKPYVYLDYNYALSPNLHVTRFALTGDLDGTQGGGLDLDLASKRDILADLPDDFPLHNGGTLLFAPDGSLFVSVGDDNVPCSAQDVHQLRGKLLRLSVLGVPDGPGSAPDYQAITPPDNPFAGNPDPRTRLVWAYGLRNPWSYDLDPTTGTLAIADVGNDAYEEIDLVTQGGRNLGWPLYEGLFRFEYPLCIYSDTLTLLPPVWSYPHAAGPSAVMMGGTVRFDPNALANFPPEYLGNVFYAELYTGKLYRLACAGGTCAPAPPVPGQPDTAAWATELATPTRLRFGPDAGLWYVNGLGDLRRIRADLLLAVDPHAGTRSIQLRAFPVPSAGDVRMSFRLPTGGPVTVFVSDARGRRVRTLVQEAALPAGEHVAAWDGRDDDGTRVAPGVYFGTLRSAAGSAHRRLVLLSAR